TPTITSSFSQNTIYDKALNMNTGNSLEVDLEPGWRLQLVYVRTDSGGIPLATFAVINEPLDVAVTEMPPVAVASLPSVSLDSPPTSLSVVVSGVGSVTGTQLELVLI